MFRERTKELLIAARHPKLPYTPIIREFDDSSEFFEQLAEAEDPPLGIVAGHGEWNKIGSVTKETLSDLKETDRERIRAAWNRSGGIAVLSCYSSSDSVRGDISVANDLANALRKPVAGSVESVRDVAISRRVINRGPQQTDHWTFEFDSYIDTGTVTYINEPDEPTPGTPPVRIKAKTVPSPAWGKKYRKTSPEL